MEKLRVVYDADCAFCVRCRWWLAMQPAYITLEFLAAGSPEAARRFPSLAGAREDLTVIDEDGGVYRGPDAFIMCLYALVDYRELSEELAAPMLRPFAKAAFRLVSASRGWLSMLMGAPDIEKLRASQDAG
jgi:predicted DCC family thiol-disulfide oxidoreductase YuxK